MLTLQLSYGRSFKTVLHCILHFTAKTTTTTTNWERSVYLLYLGKKLMIVNNHSPWASGHFLLHSWQMCVTAVIFLNSKCDAPSSVRVCVCVCSFVCVCGSSRAVHLEAVSVCGALKIQGSVCGCLIFSKTYCIIQRATIVT